MQSIFVIYNRLNQITLTKKYWYRLQVYCVYSLGYSFCGRLHGGLCSGNMKGELIQKYCVTYCVNLFGKGLRTLM